MTIAIDARNHIKFSIKVAKIRKKWQIKKSHKFERNELNLSKVIIMNYKFIEV